MTGRSGGTVMVMEAGKKNKYVPPVFAQKKDDIANIRVNMVKCMLKQ